MVARAAGRLSEIEAPQRFLLFNLRQRFKVGSEWYTVWFPPDNLLQRAQLLTPQGGATSRVFHTGEDIKLKVISGDHLLVDRFTYNFRSPRRGEIIVFETRGIPTLPQDQFYIKRMVAQGNEQVQIGGATLLHVAAYRGDQEIVSLLLQHRADKHARMTSGERPVDLAQQQGHRALIPLLEP